ncbi:hypothetical protein CERSUDRAFT_58517, partial [Gelatoporia subvermispora B]
LDLITGLSPLQGFDIVLVVVDRYTKLVTFISCSESIGTVKFGKTFINQVVFRFGLPEHIILD